MSKQFFKPFKKSTRSDLNIDLSEFYLMGEDQVVSVLLGICQSSEEQKTEAGELASSLVTKIRSNSDRTPVIDAFLQEYGLSTEEGIILMRLAESLIRTPDKSNAFSLIRDKIEPGNWFSHRGDSPSKIVDLATLGLGITKGWIKTTGGKRARNLAARIGDRALYSAIFRVMQMMGDHYVLGKNIHAAIRKSLKNSGPQDAYSFDMLGEAAYTQTDADRYFEAYRSALLAIADNQGQQGFGSGQAGLSVKLSALHPRYEFVQKEKCVPELVSRLAELAVIAKNNDLNITIDAEEAERLEVSLLVLKNLCETPELQNWNGLGFVVQAYQRRAIPLIQHLIRLYEKRPNILNIRLVKGAYWDTEIKRAQEMGLESYPVFTRKENTDLSYLACAKILLDTPGAIFPRFATHNAHTAASIIQMAGTSRNYEFQRLHGMGKELHEELKSVSEVSSRVYAPVGEHEDLLPYLVRRLLENGANSSFVNQLTAEDISISEIIADPINKVTTNSRAAHPNIHDPRDHFNGERLAARGIDPTQASVGAHLSRLIGKFEPVQAHSLIAGEKPSQSIGRFQVRCPYDTREIAGNWKATNIASIDVAVSLARSSEWITQFSPDQRRNVINKIGYLIGKNYDRLLTLCVKEAGKTWPDAIAEVREAIDFCFYYANQVEDRDSLGVVACISPWNFPLAIFLGQIIGALAGGNSVICKPAAQTPLIAYEAIQLLYQAGVPDSAVHLVLGDGRELGNHLSAHPDINGICFTGSTATAKKIAGQLVKTERAHIPLIAETGGLNAMIVDSTALLEQVVADVIASAFQSAGQRCSACRVVCVQDDVADAFMTMLAGAMKELQLSNPEYLSTDVGPVIDISARTMLENYIAASKTKYRTIHEILHNENTKNGVFIGPIAFEIPGIKVLEKEIFGPVLHVMKFNEKNLETLIRDINSLGYGLTMGLHTRIDNRVDQISCLARVGNLYVNRNQIGAVVGVQPFGGEGLSGTGPKAGGPHYVRRLSKPKGTSSEEAIHSDGTLRHKTLDKLLDLGAMRAASNRWFCQLDKDKLQDLVEICVDHFGVIDTAYLSKMIFFKDRQIILPGPTGESNNLKLNPRGIILCDGGAPLESLCQHLLKSLATGNAVILLSPDPEHQRTLDKLIVRLTAVTGQRNLIYLVNGIPFNPENILHLGAVLTTRERINIWAKWALSMDGQLVPILTSDDEIERFFIERTLTVNTTAAGGNATLLAM